MNSSWKKIHREFCKEWSQVPSRQKARKFDEMIALIGGKL